jgi:1-acyl-sn-glycerol-3-phosphate acyltransferase
MIRTILQPFYTFYALLTFVVSVLLFFPIALILSIPNKPRSRRLIWTMLHYWGKGWLWLIGMPLHHVGKVPDLKLEDRFVIVANHISYIDAIAILPAINGYFRPLGKKEFSKIPLVGFIYKQVVLMVDRSSTHSRARSMKLMSRSLRQESHILIFPEGTFNETGAPLKEFYDGAFRLAINAQRPILPLLLPDTVDRWHYSHWWKLWPGRNRAIYLDPIPVTGLTTKELLALKQQVFEIMAEGLVKARGS